MKHRILILAALTSLLVFSVPATAGAQTTWAPAATAAIRPGSATLTGNAICTTNFVFTDSAGNVYLGQAAHCTSTAEATALDGCINTTLPVGTQVRVAGASRPATLVYNSWTAMQQRGETDVAACLYNDFALLKLDPQDYPAVNPSARFWGGPTGTVPSSFEGAAVYGYGSTIGAGRVAPHAKTGVSLRQAAGGWTHILAMDPPGVSGDSGSGVMDGQGRAFGVLSTYSTRRGLNGASDLSRMLDYMRASGFGADIDLAHGTEPFAGAARPASPAQDPVVQLLDQVLGGLLGQLGF